MIPCGPRLDHHTSTPDSAAAYDRHESAPDGPADRSHLHRDDVAPARVELTPEWQAFFDASLAEVAAARRGAPA